ncbi:trehalose-6-phosphate phosphatase, biosynthetic [Luteimonas sp. 9C]|uniref:trehalose-phosphatase n=1 Tax=Luteimonas sp. 9C TaxID=2653148 RepID=UPI0012EFFCE2|nr:trehalose-phosphatase [Luteimonas sp. 9C]VXA98574.1 trehalose-6-phosphate phosphatase, biosynthetic [Luteimonas sp. 9C]
MSALPPPPALPGHAALFLDVDGCLLPFAPRPDAVSVPPALLARLIVLQQQLGGALALVSGRNLATLDQLFAPQVFAAAGLHGVERRRSGHTGAAGDVPPALARARQAAMALIESHPGALVEDKGAALGLHWRMVAPARKADTERALQAFAADALIDLPGYQLQPGDHVIELRPRHADKGSAILAFLDEAPFAGRVPVFAGDDLTDEPGFRAVNAQGGISVLVGDRAGSAARFRLPDPAAVHAWLRVATDAPTPEVSP